MSELLSLIKSKMGNATKPAGNTRVKIPRPPPDAHRRLFHGFGSLESLKDKIAEAGSLYEGLAAAGVLDLVKQAKACPLFNMPTIEETRWTIDGPMADADVVENFGVDIDIFGSSKNPNGIAYVETTMAQNGELQTNNLVCAIGVHLEPEPLAFSLIGNAWSHPAAAVAQPPSPDRFTQLDRFNGSLGAAFAGAVPTQFMLPAVYDHGWWMNYAMWHMSRGYNLLWQIGNHTTLVNDVLRNTAFMPDSGQEGSASSSQVATADFVRRLNDKYDSLGAALNFLKVNFNRIGTVTTAPGIFNGIFQATRAFDLVNATFGGINLRSALANNTEYRKLSVPYLIEKGVPIGLKMKENDSVQAGLMRRYLSASQGQGNVIPPLITDEQNINAALTISGVTPVMLEQTLDVAPAAIVNVPQQVDAERVYFKGGEGKISLKVKGYEVDDDWYNQLSLNPDLRKVVLNAAGADWAA